MTERYKPGDVNKSLYTGEDVVRRYLDCDRGTFPLTWEGAMPKKNWNPCRSANRQRNASKFHLNNSLLMAFVFEAKTSDGWVWQGLLRIGCLFTCKFPPILGTRNAHSFQSEDEAKREMQKEFNEWHALLVSYPNQDQEG